MRHCLLPASTGAPPPTADGRGKRRHRWSGYCRLTLAFVIGVYLPWVAEAPDLARHLGEAVHSWVILFFAPIAAWRLASQARGNGRRRPRQR